MRLYFAPGTCSLACWIALEWAGAEYEVEQVDPHADSYRRINPLGMVPAIDIGSGRVMTQADAILQYIAERYPEARLGPDDDLEARFAFNETMAFLTGDFHPAFWPFFVPDRFTTDSSDAAREAVRASAPARVERVLAHLDGLIADTGHVHAGRRTVADAYGFVMTRWADKVVKGWRRHANLAAFMDRTGEDAAVKAVLQRSDA